jgi:hypothetical protein
MDMFGRAPKRRRQGRRSFVPRNPRCRARNVVVRDGVDTVDGHVRLRADAVAGRIRVIVDADIFITVGGGEVAVVEFRNGRVIGSVEGVIVGVTVSRTQRKTGWNARRSAGNGCEKIKVVLSRVRTAVKGYGKYGTMFSELQYSKRRQRSLQRLQEKTRGCLGMPARKFLRLTFAYVA